MEDEMFALIFSATFVWNISRSKKKLAVSHQKYVGLHINYPLLLSWFNGTLLLSTDFRKKKHTQIQNFIKASPVATGLFCEDAPIKYKSKFENTSVYHRCIDPMNAICIGYFCNILVRNGDSTGAKSPSVLQSHQYTKNERQWTRVGALWDVLRQIEWFCLCSYRVKCCPHSTMVGQGCHLKLTVVARYPVYTTMQIRSNQSSRKSLCQNLNTNYYGYQRCMMAVECRNQI
jgi:hypothetical protein